MERTKSEGNINNQTEKFNKSNNKLLQKTKSLINFKNCYNYNQNNNNNIYNNNNNNITSINSFLEKSSTLMQCLGFILISFF